MADLNLEREETTQEVVQALKDNFKVLGYEIELALKSSRLVQFLVRSFEHD